MSRTSTLPWQSRGLTSLAILGAIPLTAGAVIWIVGTAMRLSSRRGWGGRIGTAEVMILAGLACGLLLFVFAAVRQRRMPWWGDDEHGDRPGQ
jgi:hypothetical protein